jgi:hypothetical protein
MPPPRVNYKDLPKAARDQIDKDHGQKDPQSKKDKEFKIKFAADAVKARQESDERGSTTKDFREMKKRNEPKEKEKSKEPTTKQKVMGFLKDRAESIAHETRDIRPRGRGGSVYGAVGMGLPANPDLFGVGGFGSMHGMMGADPFHEMQPRRNPQPAPQRKRSKKKRKPSPRAPASRQGGMPGMGMGIPKGMKWMFGQ